MGKNCKSSSAGERTRIDRIGLTPMISVVNFLLRSLLPKNNLV